MRIDRNKTDFSLWKKLKQFGGNLQRGISIVAFPNVCVCCGVETTQKERQLCSFCKEERFELANTVHALSSGNVILPEYVCIQHALWNFDKGGSLQDLLHYLKYERLTGIGTELGILLGESMKEHPVIKERFSADEVILVPVPLHYLKFRKRGFNQAFMIAKGLQQVWGVAVCDIDAVVRRKNTRSQTGFSLQKRIANMQGAFKIRKPEIFRNKSIVIVDDVFTTGSTTFELARTLKQAGCGAILIATVAQA